VSREGWDECLGISLPPADRRGAAEGRLKNPPLLVGIVRQQLELAQECVARSDGNDKAFRPIVEHVFPPVLVVLITGQPHATAYARTRSNPSWMLGKTNAWRRLKMCLSPI
jgi:hypothetical protein